MIKVTFKTQDGTYWAICEKMRYIRGSGYFIESVTEDSCSRGFSLWSKIPDEWKVILVEEA